MLRDFELVDNSIVGIALYTGHKIDAIFSPIGKQAVITVASIHCDDGPGGQRNVTCNGEVMFFAFGHIGISSQIAIVVQ